MDHSIKSYLVRSFTVVALTALMVGCGRSPSSTSASSTPPACSENPYLQKYGCSISKIQRAAENGNADAQYALGYMYYYGIDTAQDKQTAELWIQRAAAQGQPLAKKAWTLINSNASFTDFHKAAAGQVGTASRAASTVVQQEPVDVDKMNTTTPTQPITNHLPAYNMGQTEQKASPAPDQPSAPTAEKKDSSVSQHHFAVNDPRLSSKAAPETASKPVQSSHLDSAHVASNAKGGYTIQLLGADSLSEVKSFISTHQLAHKAHYYRTALNGKPWYMLTYGQYRTESHAQAAIAKLPESLQGHHPWVKSFATVRKEVATQKVVA